MITKKPKFYLLSIVSICIVIIAVAMGLDHNFLPTKVLNIGKFPEGIEVIESGDNASIGTQTFVNEWLLKVTDKSFAKLLSGQVYSICKNPKELERKIHTLLKTHQYFSYTDCRRYITQETETTIYLHSPSMLALTQYQTE